MHMVKQMDAELETMLNLRRLPGRLTIHQVGVILGFPIHDISILIQTKLLKPLGNPPDNGHKYFSAAEIEALAKDRNWLDKASRTVTRHWQGKNHNQRHKETLRAA